VALRTRVFDTASKQANPLGAQRAERDPSPLAQDDTAFSATFILALSHRAVAE
jgi:hypothetical protein